jgi:hypothetical protein
MPTVEYLRGLGGEEKEEKEEEEMLLELLLEFSRWVLRCRYYICIKY